MATVLAMVFSSMPYLPVSSLVFPVAVSWVFGSFLYIFIMPSLSGFVELGLLIFAAIFAITYLFSKPHQALGRVVGVVLFLVMTSVNNQQTYNFLTVADTGLMFALIILLLAITAFFPVSSRPEKAFIRLLRRFFKHSEFLFLHFARDWEQKKGVSGRLKAFVYRENLLDLFRKIEIWSSNINHRLFPDTTPEQIKALTTSLQTLAYRINEIADARDQSQSKLLVKELAGDVRPWRIAIQEVFREWGSDPKFKPGGDLHQRLAKRLEKLELRINETFELAQKGKITPQDYANFYRIMGSFRSLSEAVINHARLTREINWAQLEEERF